MMLVYNMGKVAQQRLSPSGVIFVMVPASVPCVGKQESLREDPNRVQKVYTEELTRYVHLNVFTS